MQVLYVSLSTTQMTALATAIAPPRSVTVVQLILDKCKVDTLQSLSACSASLVQLTFQACKRLSGAWLNVRQLLPSMQRLQRLTITDPESHRLTAAAHGCHQ